jgi:1,4-dihydroxy-2-naphthoate octaprenyltransferase
MSAAAVWLLAIRPKTLGLSLSPILAGSCVAWWETREFYWLPAMAALLSAIFIQIGTNLHNDAADAQKGTDGDDRLGPLRVTAQGLLSATQVKRGALIAFTCAFLPGIYLVWAGGWVILLLGLASLLAGVAYSGGPWPISASPLGELFVFVFFGLGATGGSYYLQTGSVSTTVLIAGSMLGLFAAAVLVVNNYRDRNTDACSGRKTLAVLVSPRVSRIEYAVLMLLPFLLLLYLVLFAGLPALALLPLLTLPAALYLVVKIRISPIDSSLNLLLANTAKLQMVFAVLFCISFST